MVIKHFKNRVNALRQEPEDVRWRAAVRWTAISGSIISLLWLFILLPLQLRFQFSNEAADEPLGTVQGAQRYASPTPSTPTATPEVYHGTRPSQRQPASLTPYTSITPSPTPLPLETRE